MGARRWRMGAAIGLALACGTAGAEPSGATNFGSAGGRGSVGTTNGVWLTTNATWGVRFLNLEPATLDGAYRAVWDQYSPTDLVASTATASTCTASVDLCVFDADYGDNGLYGWNACAGATSGAHPNQRCSVQYVRINLRYGAPRGRTACHEIGHSVGLRHTATQGSCLKPTADGGTSQVLVAHDRSHLNAAY